MGGRLGEKCFWVGQSLQEKRKEKGGSLVDAETKCQVEPPSEQSPCGRSLPEVCIAGDGE